MVVIWYRHIKLLVFKPVMHKEMFFHGTCVFMIFFLHVTCFFQLTERA